MCDWMYLRDGSGGEKGQDFLGAKGAKAAQEYPPEHIHDEQELHVMSPPCDEISSVLTRPRPYFISYKSD